MSTKKYRKWFEGLPYKTQWNLSVNYLNHLDSLTDEDIEQIYKDQHPNRDK